MITEAEEITEQIDSVHESYIKWEKGGGEKRDDLDHYPFVRNKRAPFVTLRRALPHLNLALVTSAGAYVNGMASFNTTLTGGDLSFREIPTQITAKDLRIAARGYNPEAVLKDINAQIPLERLAEFEANAIIGSQAQAFWSLCGYITDAASFVNDTLPKLVTRIKRYEAQGVLLIPASRLCHQTMALAARALELAGLPTMTLAVNRKLMEAVRPPRAVYYDGEFGSVAGQPLWPEHQRRVLDEALRLLEPMDQPGIIKLDVELETEVEIGRGER